MSPISIPYPRAAAMGSAPSDYNGQDLLLVAIVFLCITYLSIFLRCYVRLLITKAFAMDDWLILVAQCNFTVSCSLILRGVHYGLGRHNQYLSQEAEILATKYQDLATVTYVSNMMFIKLSIAIFLLRIAVKRRYIWILKISMFVVGVWSTGCFFFTLFQCWPVEAQWDYTIKSPKCVSSQAFVNAAYSISVLSIVSDWMYALLPIPMIWSAKMNFHTKFTVAFILSLGIFASIATLIRLRYLLGLADQSDILFTGTPAMVWTLVEPGVAITAAALITIRPLLRAIKFPGFESTNPKTPDRRTPARTPLAGIPSDSFKIPSQTVSKQIGVPEVRLQRSGSSASVLALGSDDDRGGPGRERRNSKDLFMHDGSSDEYILMGIRKTVDVSVSSDGVVGVGGEDHAL